MNKPPRTIVWLLAASAAVGAGVVGSLIRHEDGAGAADASAAPGQQTVRAARGDITVVVSLDAASVPLPSFRLLSPGPGTVRIAGGRDGGRTMKGGAAVFRTESLTVRAPVAARLERWLVPDGADVGSGVPVAELRYMGFGLVGSLPATESYRLLSGKMTATGSITGGPAGFRCPVLQVPPSKVDPATAAAVSPMVMCAVPPDVRAFPDLKGQIAVTSGQVTNVLTLPVTAVSGGADRGEVSVVLDDGTVAIRGVGLGATDGAMVQITEGLEDGARVLASPPPLLR
jgi:multidrug efflux pump subunit AcrA (membrane-fusion protein)